MKKKNSQSENAARLRIIFYFSFLQLRLLLCTTRTVRWSYFVLFYLEKKLSFSCFIYWAQSTCCWCFINFSFFLDSRSSPPSFTHFYWQRPEANTIHKHTLWMSIVLTNEWNFEATFDCAQNVVSRHQSGSANPCMCRSRRYVNCEVKRNQWHRQTRTHRQMNHRLRRRKRKSQENISGFWMETFTLDLMLLAMWLIGSFQILISILNHTCVCDCACVVWRTEEMRRQLSNVFCCEVKLITFQTRSIFATAFLLIKMLTFSQVSWSQSVRFEFLTHSCTCYCH